MIALAAFDIAGTTVDEQNAVYRVLAAVVADHGTPARDTDIRRWMGADKREALAALTGDPAAVEDLHAQFVTRLHHAYATTRPTPCPASPKPSPHYARQASVLLSPLASTARSPTRCWKPSAGASATTSTP